MNQIKSPLIVEVKHLAEVLSGGRKRCIMEAAMFGLYHFTTETGGTRSNSVKYNVYKIQDNQIMCI